MNGKIIFVGLHNKPGMKPLDLKTKSGKLIDRIVDPLRHKGRKVILTNLFDVDHMPHEKEMDSLAMDWVNRVELFKDDIVVLLGQTVHENFPKLPVKTLKIAHPASKRSHKEMDEYVALINKEPVTFLLSNALRHLTQDQQRQLCNALQERLPSPASIEDEAERLYPYDATLELNSNAQRVDQELTDMQRSAHITCARQYISEIERLKHQHNRDIINVAAKVQQEMNKVAEKDLEKLRAENEQLKKELQAIKEEHDFRNKPLM